MNLSQCHVAGSGIDSPPKQQPTLTCETYGAVLLSAEDVLSLRHDQQIGPGANVVYLMGTVSKLTSRLGLTQASITCGQLHPLRRQDISAPGVTATKN